MAEMEFGYWKIRGLGAVFRMMLEYKEVAFKDVQYGGEDAPDWFGGRKPEILKINPLANLPYLVDGDICVCQTNAILNYLADKYGLNGVDQKSKIRNQELICEIYDVRNAMIDLVYPFRNVIRSQEEFEQNAAKKVDEPPFAKFEACMNLYGGDWFASADGPCTCDFHIWEMLDQHKLLAEKLGKPPLLDAFPKCKAFYERFRALPTLQKYFASDSYKLDINNAGAGAYFK